MDEQNEIAETKENLSADQIEEKINNIINISKIFDIYKREVE